jgi:DNA-binding transcriptional LysR family regulator
LAIGLVPPSFVEHSDSVTTVPIRHQAPQFELAIATPVHRRLSAAAEALLETITRQAGRPA